MAFCGSSAWSKVALVLIVVALAVHCAGYGTNYWMARKTVREKVNFAIGLWKKVDCLGTSCSTARIPTEYITTCMWVTRVLEGLTGFVLLVTVVFLGFYVATDFVRTRRVAITITLFAFFAAGLSLAGMITWLINIPENHYASWSMGLTVLAATMSVTSLILLLPDICQYDYGDNAAEGVIFEKLSDTGDVKVKKKQSELEPVVAGETNLKPKIIPQHPLAAPSYQFMQYNTRKLYDGF